MGAKARQSTGVSINSLSDMVGDSSAPHNQLRPSQPAPVRSNAEQADGAPWTCEFIKPLHTTTCEYTHAGFKTHRRIHTWAQTYTFALQLEKSKALGYLQSQWCLNTFSVVSSGDWQRLNEYFLSLNSIINSLAVSSQEKMFTFTLGESYSEREFSLQVSENFHWQHADWDTPLS